MPRYIFSAPWRGRLLRGTIFPDNLCPDTYFRPKMTFSQKVLSKFLDMAAWKSSQCELHTKWFSVSIKIYPCPKEDPYRSLWMAKLLACVCIPSQSINGAAESLARCKYALTAWETVVILEPPSFYSAPGIPGIRFICHVRAFCYSPIALYGIKWPFVVTHLLWVDTTTHQ